MTEKELRNGSSLAQNLSVDALHLQQMLQLWGASVTSERTAVLGSTGQFSPDVISLVNKGEEACSLDDWQAQPSMSIIFDFLH